MVLLIAIILAILYLVGVDFITMARIDGHASFAFRPITVSIIARRCINGEVTEGMARIFQPRDATSCNGKIPHEPYIQSSGYA